MTKKDYFIQTAMILVNLSVRYFRPALGIRQIEGKLRKHHINSGKKSILRSARIQSSFGSLLPSNNETRAAL